LTGASPQKTAPPESRGPRGTTQLSVVVAFVVNATETAALGAAAWLTGSVALRAQAFTSAADVAVAVFLLIGVVRSVRPADESHPLGYGRERFFWSLFAALGIFVGGGGLALEEAIRSALHPGGVHSYATGYLVLGATAALDTLAFAVALHPLRREATERGITVLRYLGRSTDPASTTVAVGGACALIGALTAAIGLAASELSGAAAPDTAAGALIGAMLIIASVLLLRVNRELLSGRGVSPAMLTEMRQLIAAQHGVRHVRDLFAVVVGPSSLIVNGDVTFADELDVPEVEEAIAGSVAALRSRWPSVEYVYLTPVPEARPRRSRGPRTHRRAGD